jgi:hypothetical protein
MHMHIYQNLAALFSAAICLLKGGHTIILNAFDFFKLVCTATLVDNKKYYCYYKCTKCIVPIKIVEIDFILEV